MDPQLKDITVYTLMAVSLVLTLLCLATAGRVSPKRLAARPPQVSRRTWNGMAAAGLASLLLAGGGQIVNKQWRKAILYMITCFLLWFLMLGYLINLLSFLDALRVAYVQRQNPWLYAFEQEISHDETFE